MGKSGCGSSKKGGKVDKRNKREKIGTTSHLNSGADAIGPFTSLLEAEVRKGMAGIGIKRGGEGRDIKGQTLER